MAGFTKLQVIDSHTAGEPTRVIVSGGPELGGGTVAAQRMRLAEEHDWLRTSCVSEPRGHDALVGALLCEPSEPCLLYTSPSPRDGLLSRMPSSA